MNVKGYEQLAAVLEAAYDQAAKGKGAERHANSKPFHEQPMQDLIALYGPGFALGQAAKKMQEAQRMNCDAAERELLGAINYIAGAVIALTADDKRGDWFGTLGKEPEGLPPEACVEVETRGGTKHVGPVREFDWRHRGHGREVVRYRVV